MKSVHHMPPYPCPLSFFTLANVDPRNPWLLSKSLSFENYRNRKFSRKSTIFFSKSFWYLASSPILIAICLSLFVFAESSLSKRSFCSWYGMLLLWWAILNIQKLKRIFKLWRILLTLLVQFYAIFQNQTRSWTEQWNPLFFQLCPFFQTCGYTLSLIDSRNQDEWLNLRRVNRYRGK